MYQSFFIMTIYQIHPKDLLRIYANMSLRTAQRKYRTIRDALGLQKNQKVTLEKFCEYEGENPDRVKLILGVK